MLKQRSWIWMPPDGDNRALKLKQTWGDQLGRIEFLIRPPFLELPPDFRPASVLSTGGWKLDAGGLFLEVADDSGSIGWLRLAEAWRGALPALELGPPPEWIWRRGRLGWMDEDVELARGQWAWSVEPFSGWKAP